MAPQGQAIADRDSHGGGSGVVATRKPERTEAHMLAAWALGVIGFMGCGVFVLDDARKVLFLNSLATALLGDGLVVISDRLVATDRDSEHQLAALIASGARRRPGAVEPTSAAIRRDCRLPLVARSMMIDASIRSMFDSATRLLVVSDPELRAGPPPDLFGPIFGLTPAEIQVALGVAHGRKLAEIAADHGNKVGTVRAQAKAVLAKTGTRSQAELAALLGRFVL
jgi:DNA-binding CsgD family transcriptional regulator